MKRAAVLVTDAESALVTFVHSELGGSGEPESNMPAPFRHFRVELSEQLLADLRALVDAGLSLYDCRSAAARVRALLPKEDNDGD